MALGREQRFGQVIQHQAYDTADPAVQYGSPALGTSFCGEHLFVGSASGDVTAIDTADGSVLWQTNPCGGNGTTNGNCGDDGFMDSSPAVSDDCTLYIASSGGYLFALDASDGSIKWSYSCGTGGSGGSPSPILSSPAIMADGTTVVVGSTDDKLYFVDGTSGDLSDLTDLGAGASVYLSSPAVNADDHIFIGAEDGNLYEVKKGSSNPFHTYTASGGEIYSSQAIDSTGRVVVGSDDGYLWAFGTGTPPPTPSPTSLFHPTVAPTKHKEEAWYQKLLDNPVEFVVFVLALLIILFAGGYLCIKKCRSSSGEDKGNLGDPLLQDAAEADLETDKASPEDGEDGGVVIDERAAAAES